MSWDTAVGSWVVLLFSIDLCILNTLQFLYVGTGRTLRLDHGNRSGLGPFLEFKKDFGFIKEN